MHLYVCVCLYTYIREIKEAYIDIGYNNIWSIMAQYKVGLKCMICIYMCICLKGKQSKRWRKRLFLLFCNR